MKDDLQKFLSELEADRNANDDIRDMCNEELRFALVPGAQWEDWDIKGYSNRPKLEIDMTSPYLMRTYAKYCDSRVQPDFQPDDGAGDDLSDVVDGLYRRDVHRRGGQDAIDTAVFEAMACGFGAILFGEEYDDEEDLDNDRQNIKITEINNAYSSVFFDCSSKRADKADAQHVTLLTMYSREKFSEIWPDKEFSSLTTRDRKSFNYNVGNNMTYVATRYDIREKREKFYFYTNPMVQGENATQRLPKNDHWEKDDALLRSQGYKFTRARTLKIKSVYKTVFSGSEILEKPTRIQGKLLPVVPCYGFRMFVDGSEYFHGLSRKKIDSQRMFNMVGSLTAESAARSHPAIPILTNDQMANEESQKLWRSDKSKLAFLTVDPHVDETTGQTQFGPVGYLKGEAMTQSGAQLVQMTNDILRQQVGGAPQDITDPNASGKALNAMIGMADQDTRILFDNITKFAKRCGEVWLSKAKEVYSGKDNAGRVMRIFTKKDQTKPITLLEQQGGPNGVQTVNDVSKGRFEVVVDVGKSYQTKQEETFEQLKDILSVSQNTPLFNTLLSALIQSMPSAGMEDIKKYLRRQQLAEGTAQPESQEELEYLQSLQASTANQGPDAQTSYIMSEAAKNAAEIQKVQSEIAKNEAVTEKTRVEAAAKAQDIRKNFTQ